jgi:hypothetical protein
VPTIPAIVKASGLATGFSASAAWAEVSMPGWPGTSDAPETGAGFEGVTGGPQRQPATTIGSAGDLIGGDFFTTTLSVHSDTAGCRPCMFRGKSARRTSAIGRHPPII